jgi:large subunit ribosomal protein L29
MKMRELVELGDPELLRRLADLQEELFNLRFQFATRQLTNHSRMREVRRDVARVRTLLRQRELIQVEA